MLKYSLAGSVILAGFVPVGGESGGLMISLMLCVDQGHGTMRAWGKRERAREKEHKPRTQQLNHSSLLYSSSARGTDLYTQYCVLLIDFQDSFY